MAATLSEEPAGAGVDGTGPRAAQGAIPGQDAGAQPGRNTVVARAAQADP